MPDSIEPLHAPEDLAASQAAYRDALIQHGLLIPTGVDGIYGRSAVFEDVLARFDALVLRASEADNAEHMHFPPAITRTVFEESGYLKSFPHFAGTVHTFRGNERDHANLLKLLEKKEDWTERQKATELVLTPAACYPIYPTIAQRGNLPAEGARVHAFTYCFRHEPSIDPARMQLFRVRECVRIGTREQVLEFRETWLERGRSLLESLEVPVTIDIANDPFFGRVGKMMAANQRDLSLKFELLIPITSQQNQTACSSFNYHQDHFGHIWDLRTHDGEMAETACVGFGMERVTLALFKHHGFDVAGWPSSVRAILWG